MRIRILPHCCSVCVCVATSKDIPGIVTQSQDTADLKLGGKLARVVGSDLPTNLSNREWERIVTESTVYHEDAVA